MLAIYRKELRAYYLSPAGYVFMALFLIVSALFFVSGNLFTSSPDFAPFLGSILFVFLIFVPLLTMKLMAEESRNKTDQLLLTSPVPVSGIVAGKFLAAFTVFFLTLLITGLYAFIISLHGDLDISETLGSYAGFLFLGGAFISIGIFISSLTDSQPIAAITTFGALFITWIVDFIQNIAPSGSLAGLIFTGFLIFVFLIYLYQNTRNLVIPAFFLLVTGLAAGLLYFFIPDIYIGLTGKVLSWLSLTRRYQSFTLGLLKMNHIIYYISVTVFFLFLTIQHVEKKRWS